MKKEQYLGPIYLDCHGIRTMVCLSVSKGHRISFKVHYGGIFLSAPSETFFTYLKTDDLAAIEMDPLLQAKTEKMATELLDKYSVIKSFTRRHISFKSEPYLSLTYGYILGERKEVCLDYKNYKYGMLYAKNMTLLTAAYNEMALAHFVKRVAYYCEKMNISNVFKIRLSESISYLGMNNIKKNILSFNPQIYAYRIEVGDAIIVHEIAHFLVHSHSKDFYDIVIKYCPDYYKYSALIAGGQFDQG